MKDLEKYEAYKSDLKDIDLDNISFGSHVMGHKMDQPEKMSETRQNALIDFAFDLKDDIHESVDEAAESINEGNRLNISGLSLSDD